MIDENAVNRIEDLHKLKEAGVITEEEFNKAKQDLLFKARPVKEKPVLKAITGEIPAADDFLNWILLPLRKYADFNGRSCRKEFWMFMLTYLAVILVSGVFAIASMELGTVLLALYFIAAFIPTLAVQVRRFHDQNLSGWFALLNLIPYLGGVIVLVFMCLDGTAGDNRFGEDPKGRS